jgi:hypothetical protein
VDSGLDEADKIASVAGAIIAVAGLILTIRGARGQRPASDRASSASYPAIWLIGGLAVIALCAIPLWGLIYAASHLADGGSGDSPPGGPATPTETRSAGAASPVKPAAAPVLWKGEVRLDGTPRDFDYEPPARGNTSTDLSSDGYLNGSAYNRFWGRGVVLWPGQADPSREDCAARLQTHGVKEVNIDARSRICLETSEGRIVFIKVLRRDGDDGYNSQVTLWSSG